MAIRLADAVESLCHDLAETIQRDKTEESDSFFTVEPMEVEFKVQFSTKDNESGAWVISDESETDLPTHKITFTLTPQKNYPSGDIPLDSHRPPPPNYIR